MKLGQNVTSQRHRFLIWIYKQHDRLRFTFLYPQFNTPAADYWLIVFKTSVRKSLLTWTWTHSGVYDVTCEISQRDKNRLLASSGEHQTSWGYLRSVSLTTPHTIICLQASVLQPAVERPKAWRKGNLWGVGRRAPCFLLPLHSSILVPTFSSILLHMTASFSYHGSASHICVLAVDSSRAANAVGTDCSSNRKGSHECSGVNLCNLASKKHFKAQRHIF